MKPVHTLRIGVVCLSIWERSGSKGPFFEFTIARSFKNKDGKTAYSGSFREYDADSLLLVIKRAVEDIRDRQSSKAEVTTKTEHRQEGEETPPAVSDQAGGL